MFEEEDERDDDDEDEKCDLFFNPTTAVFEVVVDVVVDALDRVLDDEAEVLLAPPVDDGIL